MSYIEKEVKIDSLVKHFPEEMIASGDYDIVSLVVEIARTYDISYDELEGIFDELFLLLTGKSDPGLLVKKIRTILNEEKRPDGGKITEALIEKVYEPIKKALGRNFPIIVNEAENPSIPEEEKELDRNTILQGIEQPLKTVYSKYATIRPSEKSITAPSESHLSVSGAPGELRHVSSQQNEASAPTPPSKIGSIVEQKMNSVTSLHKVETSQTKNSPQKKYEVDPYREQPK